MRTIIYADGWMIIVAPLGLGTMWRLRITAPDGELILDRVGQIPPTNEEIRIAEITARLRFGEVEFARGHTWLQ